jgi:hypothetical protein
MSKNVKKNTCNLCQKIYASPQSLCNHRRSIHKVYHQQEKDDNVSEIQQKKDDTIHYEADANDNVCMFCNKVLSSRQAKSRHLKICKAKKHHEITQIKNDLEQMKIQINNTNNGTINNGTINNGTINITVNNFDEDNKNYFTDKFKERIINYFANCNMFHLPIPHVVQNLKFNPNHKENNNMKITNMKSEMGQKFQDNKWIYCKKEDMLNESHKIATLMVEGWIKENKQKISPNAVIGFQDYLKVNKEYIRKVIFEEINKLGYMYYKNVMENNLDE